MPGRPIIAREGDEMKINGFNRLPGVTTNIHWHGLRVPNNRDGPARILKPGEPFEYHFTLKDTGTYWYHSHFRPVLQQVDMGLYGVFIIKNDADDQYSGDHFFMFDDWMLGPDGKRQEGLGRGEMERYGTLETVNGKTGEAIPAVEVTKGELHKFRLLTGSSAAVHTIHVEGHRLRVTHADGRLLPEPYMTDSVILNPGERYDVELETTGEPGRNYLLLSDRSEMGIRVPIVYGRETVSRVPSPIVPTPSRSFPNVEEKTVDHTLTLGSRVKMGMDSGGGMGGRGMGGRQGMGGHGMGHMEMGGMGHGPSGGSGGMGQMAMEWTINGEVFPNVPPITVKGGELVKLRFANADTGGMHAMDHPIHLHGGFFQVVSLNGEKPEREMFKDTVNVPAGEYVDVAFIHDEPGDWMLHCHILDHEDGGMMMVMRVMK